MRAGGLVDLGLVFWPLSSALGVIHGGPGILRSTKLIVHVMRAGRFAHNAPLEPLCSSLDVSESLLLFGGHAFFL